MSMKRLEYSTHLSWAKKMSTLLHIYDFSLCVLLRYSRMLKEPPPLYISYHVFMVRYALGVLEHV